jgi:hypothetical protein
MKDKIKTQHIPFGVFVLLVALMIIDYWTFLVLLLALFYLACTWRWKSERAQAIGDYWRKGLIQMAIIIPIFFIVCFSCQDGIFLTYAIYAVFAVPILIALVRTVLILLKNGDQ